MEILDPAKPEAVRKPIKICIEPDGSLEFIVHESDQGTNKTQTWRDFFHVEVYRHLPMETLWKQKVLGYIQYAATGQHQDLFYTSALSIAVFTATEHQATALKKWTEEALHAMPHHGQRFFFRSIHTATASPTDIFLSPDWQQAFGKAKTALLVLKEGHAAVNRLSARVAGITAPKLTLGTFGPFPLLKLPLRIRLSQANTHWHIIGTSGSGKSFFLAQLFLSLLKQGSPVTLIDPHGDLAKLVLTHLVGQGRYKDTATYERIVYLDLPAGERQGRYLPFNPLKQENPEHIIAGNLKEAMHRAFPELSQGAAIFDTLLPRALRVLLANNLPITALEPFLWDEAFRSQLLARLITQDAATITNYFAHVYAELRRSEQMTYAGSVLRRAALLTDLPVLRYSFAQPENRVPFRQIMDSGTSVIINLALRELEASRLLGCLLTVGYEQAALSRADQEHRRSHHLIVDEFHSFATHSAQAFASMLSQTRKYGLYLCAAHQFWGQANQHLQDALQNTGIDVVFNVGRDVVFNVGREDAEYTARTLFRIDPLHVKHEVEDEYAVEKTHPVYYSLAEQQQDFTEYLQDLPPRHFALKVRGKKVKAGKTLHLPKPSVDPQELQEVQQEYLRRYFRSKQEIITAPERGEPEMKHSETLYQPNNQSTSHLTNHLTSQPVNRRERLR